MVLAIKKEVPSDHISLIDLIPIKLFKEDPTTETYSLGSVTVSKGEYANSEKINQVIDALNKIIPKVNLQ